MSKPKKLSAIRVAFCREYVVDFNGTRAAIAAGYSKKTARSTACELLKLPEIQAEVTRLQSGAIAKTGITVERVLKEYERIAFSRIDEVFEFADGQVTLRSDIGEDAMRCIESVETTSEITGIATKHGEDGDSDLEPVKLVRVKVRLHKKLTALDALCRYLGIDKPDAKAQRALEQFFEHIEGRVKPEVYAQLVEAVEAYQRAGIADVAEQSAQSDAGATKH